MAIEKIEKVSLALTREQLEEEEVKLISTENFVPIRIEEHTTSEVTNTLTHKTENPYENIYIELERFLQLTGYRPPFKKEEIGIKSQFPMEETEKKLISINGTLKKLIDERNQLHKDLENYEKALFYIRILHNLEINLEDITNFEFLRLIFGRVPVNHFKSLIYSSENLPILILDINKDENNVWIFVFAPPNLLNDTYKVLHSAYFKEDSLPDGYRGTPAELEKKLDSNIQLTKLAIEKNLLEIKRTLYENKEFIDQIYSKIVARKKIYELASFGAYSKGENIFFLNGWMPTKTSQSIEKKLKRNTVLIKTPAEEIPDSEKKRVPVKLKYKNKIVEAFKLITNMYSLPRYGEIDPTPFVSVLFVIMFGFMLGDVGHGLVLLLIGLFVRRKSREFGTVISTAAISSILFGFLYGSVFGFEWIPAILLRPMLKIETLMLIAVIFGIIVISMGMTLNIINGFSQKNWEKAIFGGEGIAGSIFYVTTIFSISFFLVTKKLPIPKIVLFALLGFSLLSVFFAEPLTLLIETKEKGRKRESNKTLFPDGFWIVTPISLFNLLIEFFSNTISFVRLAAFALTHEALFSAFWIMTLMVRPTPGGGLWSVLIFLLGQMILVGLEGLVVFIQDLRLTYYEFFTKFFEGNGEVFKPFSFEK